MRMSRKGDSMMLENRFRDGEAKVKSVVYELSEESIKSHPLIATKDDAVITFYSWLREAMSVGEEYNMDCTKIRVAENIQTAWIEYAENSGIDNVSINMTLLNYAPRVDEHLNNNEICIYDGFFVKSEDE